MQNKQDRSEIEIVQWLTELGVSWDGELALPRQYWTKVSDWQPKWLLDEDNAAICSLLNIKIYGENIP